MSDFKPVSEILRHLYTPEGQAHLRHEEQTFRRGYHQAYNQALDDVFELLRAGINIEEAYALTALQANLIGVWRTERVEQFILPPSFDMEKLQETLVLRRKIGKA